MSKSYPRGLDDEGKPAMVSARLDLEPMKMAIEELKTLEEKSRPQKMDVSSVAAADAFTHEEWVAWMEWQGDKEYEEEAENPSLDAIGGKAKGKGKGNNKGNHDLAKGKGKGRGRPTTRTTRLD